MTADPRAMTTPELIEHVLARRHLNREDLEVVERLNAAIEELDHMQRQLLRARADLDSWTSRHGADT